MTSHFEPTDSLTGRVAVITGGTGAIGLASARRLAHLGARCVLLYNSEAPEVAAAKAAALPGSGHLTFKAQVTDSAALQAVAQQVADQCGAVHILVNSAGGIPRGTLLDIDEERWRRAWDLKVFGYINLTRTIYAQMKARGGGDWPESVNEALDVAVNKMQWTTDGDVRRIVFLVGDAPPHMDYKDDVKYPETCKKAAEKAIIINTVQCGDNAECRKYWQDICLKAEGTYVQIPADGGKVQVVALFPAASHPSIRYPAALLTGAGPAARRLSQRAQRRRNDRRRRPGRRHRSARRASACGRAPPHRIPASCAGGGEPNRRSSATVNLGYRGLC